MPRTIAKPLGAIIKIKKMKHPLLRILTVSLLGLLVLVISSILMMTISGSTDLFKNLPFIEKTFTHTSILFFSVLFILLLSKGKLHTYGFVWNLDFPLLKIVIISLFIGFIPALISKLFINATTVNPVASFSLLEKIIYIWFWASICEEILTRGLIQGFLSPLKHIGIKIFKNFISLPVMVGALFFGAMHLMLLTLGVDIFTVLNIVVFAIILGLIAGYQTERTNSLIPAIIVHFCFNVGASILVIISLL